MRYPRDSPLAGQVNATGAGERNARENPKLENGAPFILLVTIFTYIVNILHR